MDSMEIVLDTLARAVNPRVRGWMGVRQTTSVRTYIQRLYVDDAGRVVSGCLEITTDAAKYARTKRATAAVEKARAEIVADLLAHHREPVLAACAAVDLLDPMSTTDAAQRDAAATVLRAAKII